MPKSEESRVIRSNDGEAIYNITVEVLDALLGGKDVTKKRLEQIDFSNRRFQLLSLRGLEFIGHQNTEDRSAVETISISNNQLTTLAELVKSDGSGPLFTRVQEIFAPHNYIRNLCSTRKNPLQNTWPMKFEALVELDLSNNLLESIPDLYSMPKLRKLRLQHNFIRPPWKRLQGGKQLEDVDLSFNKLDWTEKEFIKEIVLLRELHLLRRLSLRGNPFSRDFPTYYLFCMKELSTSQEKWLGKNNKKRFNIEQIDDHECTMAMYETAIALQHPANKRKEFLNTIGDPLHPDRILQSSEEEYFGGILRNSQLYEDANLYRINLVIEKCNQDPSSFVTCTNALYKMATGIRDRVSLNVYLFDDLVPLMFQQDKSEKLKYEKLVVDTFIQNISMTLQSNENIKIPIMRVCCLLAGAPDSNGVLGLKCMEFLSTLALAKDYAVDVLEQIIDCVVPQLKYPTRTPDMFQMSKKILLRGLTNFCVRTNLSKPLQHIVPQISAWLQEPDSAEFTHLLLFTVSETVKNYAATKTFATNTNFIQAILSIWHGKNRTYRIGVKDDSFRGKDEYIYILHIFQKLAEVYSYTKKKVESPSGTQLVQEHLYYVVRYFRKDNIHLELLQHLEKGISQLANPQGSGSESYLANILFCLKSFCLYRDALKDILIPSEKFLHKLKRICGISLRQTSRVHPKLLSASWQWMLSVMQSSHFEQPIVYPSINRKIDRVMLRKSVIDSLSSVPHLLSFIDEKDLKYARVCEIVGRGKGATDPQGKILPFSLMHNSDIQTMIKDAIDLIRHFSIIGRVKTPEIKYLQDILQQLDQHGREKYLFNCLSIKNDQVKIAAIRCLNETPLDQFDVQELTKLLEIVRSSEDIAAGETEIVLSEAFNLLSRLVLFENSLAIREFRIKGGLGEDAINIAWMLLLKNSGRRTFNIEKEDREKFRLSEAIVRFFQACGAWNESETARYTNTLRYAEEDPLDEFQAEQMMYPFRELLLSESAMENFVKFVKSEDEASIHFNKDKKNRLFAKYAPVLLENTYIGRQIEYLLTAIEGWDVYTTALDSQGPVLARLLRRMADVLIGVEDSPLSSLNHYWQGFQNSVAAKTCNFNLEFLQRNREIRQAARTPQDLLREKFAEDENNDEFMKSLVDRCKRASKMLLAKGSWNTADEIHVFDDIFLMHSEALSGRDYDSIYELWKEDLAVRILSKKNKTSKNDAKINPIDKTTVVCPRVNVAEMMESSIPEWFIFNLHQRCGTYIRDYFEERNRILQHEALAKYGGLQRLLNSIFCPQDDSKVSGHTSNEHQTETAQSQQNEISVILDALLSKKYLHAPADKTHDLKTNLHSGVANAAPSNGEFESDDDVDTTFFDSRVKRYKGKVGIRHALLRAFIVSDVDDSSNTALRDKYQSADKDVLVDRLASMIYNQIVRNADNRSTNENEAGHKFEANYSTKSTTKVLAPLLRVLMGLLNTGSRGTIAKTREVLRSGSTFMKLLSICIGHISWKQYIYMPHFLDEAIGAKVMLLAQRVLDFPILQDVLCEKDLSQIEMMGSVCILFLEVVYRKLSDSYVGGNTNLPQEYLELASRSLETLAIIAQLISSKSFTNLSGDIEDLRCSILSTLFPMRLFKNILNLLIYDCAVEDAPTSKALTSFDVSRNSNLRDIVRRSANRIFSILIAHDHMHRYTYLEMLSSAKQAKLHRCHSCHSKSDFKGEESNTGNDISQVGTCSACFGCSNMGYGIRHSVITDVLSKVKRIRRCQLVRKNLKEVMETAEYAGTVSHEDILSATTIELQEHGLDHPTTTVVLVITTFKIIILDFDKDGESLLYNKPREEIYYGDLERIIPGYWDSDVHVSFVDHENTLVTMSFICESSPQGKDIYNTIFTLAYETCTQMRDRRIGSDNISLSSIAVDEKEHPRLETDVNIELSLQKRYEALHKNVGQFRVLLASPIDFYLYKSKKKEFVCCGKRIVSITDSKYLAIYIPHVRYWMMPLYWEEEEDNHKQFALKKQVEKRLRSKEILTLEVQQREADQLKQLQSEFKSEIELERNRQDRCLKKMLVPDEEVPAFQLNEVEEISFTDAKSIHPYPTITIGLSHKVDFDDNENVLVQSEKFKMATTAKTLFLLRFRSDEAFVRWKRLLNLQIGHRFENVFMQSKEIDKSVASRNIDALKRSTDSFFDDQNKKSEHLYEKQGQEVRKMMQETDQEVKKVMEETQKMLHKKFLSKN